MAHADGCSGAGSGHGTAGKAVQSAGEGAAYSAEPELTAND